MEAATLAGVETPTASGKEGGRVAELARVFLKLGFTAFGGPAAHAALMDAEIVRKRRWLDEQHFLDLMAAVNFVPGPNSTELAIHVGQLRCGFRGLVVAGVSFIAPAVLIVLPIAWAYVRWGTLPDAGPILRGVGAAVAAVVIWATLRFARTALRDAFAIAVGTAATAVAAAAAWQHLQPEVPLLAAAAVAGALRARHRAGGVRVRAFALPVLFWQEIARMAWAFFKVGATLFGTGYVLVSYLQNGFVDRHGWLSERELLDAIAVGQFTPGPLLTSATFVGYLLGHTRFGGGVVGGLVGAVTATVAVFLPSFVIVAFFGPLLQTLRSKGWARGALDGMNAAVVGLMVVASLRLAISASTAVGGGGVDLLGVGILGLSLVGLAAKVNATWLIVAAGVVAAVLSLMARL